jgi:catechol 2,3-dioxygenase-like lactoylglutathione lyase family enzyme
MNFHSVVMNVADLDRSIDFYREVFGFTLLSRSGQIAAISAPESERPQVILLRSLATTGRVTGARHVGIRAFILEVASVDELEQIAHRLESRGAFVARRVGPTWTVVTGIDPDRIAVVTSSASGSEPITEEDWKALDEYVYGIGE